MSALKESVLKEVSRLRGEIQKVDKAIVPQLRRKRKYEDQLQPLLVYLKTIGESKDEEGQVPLPSVIHERTIGKKRALTHVAYDTLKRIGHKIDWKDLMNEMQKDGQYKVPGEVPSRNLRTILWRDERVVHYGGGIYGLKEWEQPSK